MNYQVYDPSPELRAFVKCFWTLEDDGLQKMVKQRIVPDGCIEMIFHYGEPYLQYLDNGTSILQPRSFIFGQITKYIEIAPTGVSGVFSTRFLPGGLILFLTLPISAFENKAVSIESIFGEKGILLEKDVLIAQNNEERIAIIEAFLLSQLADPQKIDNITKSCVETILQSQGQIEVEKLAQKMNINRRKIERKFTSVIGMSPKQLSKAVRLQATLKMLVQKKFTSLTSLAYENGYYDQAHFIKDFKEFTGLSPKLFYSENLRFAALFASAE